VNDALREHGWSRRATDFYDLANLARYGVREGLAKGEGLDDEIARFGAIKRLIGRNAALAAVNQFLSAAKRLALNISIAALVNSPGQIRFVRCCTSRDPVMWYPSCGRIPMVDRSWPTSMRFVGQRSRAACRRNSQA
jgi:hypothetical protein